MANRNRLTGLDSSFLHLEHDAATHMHVASCMVFDGPPPTHDELSGTSRRACTSCRATASGSRSSRSARAAPCGSTIRTSTLRYHVQHHALPPPGSDEQLKHLAGRAFSQQLDRNKPLWELWLVEGLEDGRFAILAQDPPRARRRDLRRRHHDRAVRRAADPAPTPGPEQPWVPRPLPSGAQLLADALLERATVPAEIARGVRARRARARAASRRSCSAT